MVNPRRIGPLQFFFGNDLGPGTQTTVIWVRLFGIGFWLGNSPRLFAERNGFVRSLPLCRGWRLRFLASARDREMNRGVTTEQENHK